MPLRKIEIIVPDEKESTCRDLLDDETVIHYWRDHSEQSGHILKVLVDAVDTESFLDKAEKQFNNSEGFRLVMVTVDATLPRIEKDENEEEEQDGSTQSEEDEDEQIQVRVSREELYTEISDAVNLNRVYMSLVVLSTIVAALGILRDNTAVVIGAMVIAPLLGPNVGLALSTTLADWELGLISIKTNIAGLLAALAISVGFGIVMTVDSNLYHIASRTEVHLSDIALALASGAAGVLAYTVGMSTAVIGVMVAVALLPPLVVAGLLLGDMQWELAYFSILLLFTNVICVNLAGIATFILQGVRPRTWYESQKAKKYNKIALAIWLTLVVLLALTIYFS
jgi:uncharacterized hydrophobic protein (TIGR00341 family)